MQKETLLAITTANQAAYTIMCLDSISSKERRLCDILLVDDASTDNTIDLVKGRVEHIITKDYAKGLTDSWNQAYRFFKKNNYKNIIISNNDVLYPENSLNSLIRKLDTYTVVAPLSNSKGVEFYPQQNINSCYRIHCDDNLPENRHKIQSLISESVQNEEVILTEKLNGYIFGFNRSIIDFEYSKEVLFDPKNVNVGNEDELWNRLSIPLMIDRRSFVFHFKGVSFNDYELKDKSLLDRNLKWTEANKFKNNRLYKTYMRLKYKVKKYWGFK